ncbi:MAG: glycosyltransferase [Lachnospiraceae bacterium]|nr:glycosyltransferase [Lachnospiraceae bacterium]
MSVSGNLKRAYLYLRRNGAVGTWYAATEELQKRKEEDYRPPVFSADLLLSQRTLSETLPEKERTHFSVLVPAYETDPRHLREMLLSVLRQTYPFFTLILADASPGAASGESRVKAALEELLNGEAEGLAPERIRYLPLAENGGISENTNRALEEAEGDYILLLDHDDLLTPNALFEMARAISEGRKAGEAPLVLYSDEDKCDGEAVTFFSPNRKPDFDRAYLYSNNYICHLLCVQRELARKYPFRKEYDGAQDFDFILRVTGGLSQKQICHVPQVLYHWRCHDLSTAANPASKRYAYDAGRRAVEDHLEGIRALPLAHVGFYLPAFEGDGFALRPELAAVGGRLLSGFHGRTVGGLMEEDGSLRYGDLPSDYSGYLHRAVLTQEAPALDLRCIRVRPELWEEFQKITGIPYRERLTPIRTLPREGVPAGKGGELLLDDALLEGIEDLTTPALAWGRRVRQLGYQMLYYPDWGRIWKK